ncbi:twin-arginine translocase TatA/TatE family subunit [bacterium]|nr:twin-arginine translocase TatA/TatE family subunit [bacterium]
MFGISGEHLLILGVILLFVGPRRLPELGHTLGKCVRNFKDAISGVTEAKYTRIDDQPASGQPRNPEDKANASAPASGPKDQHHV